MLNTNPKITIGELHKTALDFAEYLRDVFEFDTVDFSALSINEEGLISLDVELRDKFQRDAGYYERQFNGLKSFAWPFSAAAVPSREQRELSYLAAKTNQTALLHDDMASAAGRRFVLEFQKQASELRLLVDKINAE